MAAKVGRLVGANSNSFLRRKNGEKKKNLGGRGNVTMMASAAFPGMKEEYETLRLSPGSTEKDVKRSYRRLALQYHPDVCKGNDCGVQFNKINHAYEITFLPMNNFCLSVYNMGLLCTPMVLIVVAFVMNEQTVMSSLEKAKHQNCSADYHVEDLIGVGDDSWEEWMGWEGAGTLDYSSHVNIYA